MWGLEFFLRFCHECNGSRTYEDDDNDNNDDDDSDSDVLYFLYYLCDPLKPYL